MRDDEDEEELNEQETWVSKSEVKRELLELQRLAGRLLELSPGQWSKLGFDQRMLETLEESRRVKGHNALRRHVRRVAKLLREEDSERVAALFRDMDSQHQREIQRFHRLESLRDRLMREDETAMTELLSSCPAADRQRIRQLVRAGKREQERKKPPAAQRKLFNYLKELSSE